MSEEQTEPCPERCPECDCAALGPIEWPSLDKRFCDCLECANCGLYFQGASLSPVRCRLCNELCDRSNAPCPECMACFDCGSDDCHACVTRGEFVQAQYDNAEREDVLAEVRQELADLDYSVEHSTNQWRELIAQRLQTVGSLHRSSVRSSLMEVAAMAIAAIESLDRRSVCAHCGGGTVCIGRYGTAERFTFACNKCCGHGNEDGQCFMLDATEPLMVELLLRIEPGKEP